MADQSLTVLPALPGLPPLAALFYKATVTAHAWETRRRTRRHLRRLDAAQLCDVGLTRAEADREAARPFWRP